MNATLDDLHGHIHIYAFDLTQTLYAFDASTTLSPDELARSLRYPARQCRRFQQARMILRHIVSSYIGCEKADITFQYTSAGKPYIRHESRLEFNQSHSGSSLIVALTRQASVGIDIEEVRPFPNAVGIAQRFWCESETKQLLSLPLCARELYFLKHWTRKEACIKAFGLEAENDGTSFQIRLFDAPAGQVVKSPSRGPVALHDLFMSGRVCAALACTGLDYTWSIQTKEFLPLDLVPRDEFGSTITMHPRGSKVTQ